MTYLLNHFSTKNKKTVKKVPFRGPRGMMTGTGAGAEGLILFPWESGGEKWPGTLGNGFLGFPVASLLIIDHSLVLISILHTFEEAHAGVFHVIHFLTNCNFHCKSRISELWTKFCYSLGNLTFEHNLSYFVIMYCSN